MGTSLVAFSVLLTVVLWSAEHPSGAQDADAPSTPRDGDLTLGGEAGSVLVGLTVRPAEQGRSELLVHLLPLGGREDAGQVDAHIRVAGERRPVAGCGPTCRRTSVTLDGGDEITVEVAGEDGGVATFHLPQLPAPSAEGLLSEATERMRALVTYRAEEVLGPLDPPLLGSYAFRAPDRMRFELDNGQVTVRIGQHAFSRRDPAEPWRIRSGPQLEVPSHIWDYPTEAVAPRLLGAEELDGVRTQVVSFFLRAAANPVWFRLWIDDERLVRRAEMRAGGHFMDHRYHSFDEPVTVQRPVSRLAIVRYELLGTQPGWAAAAAGLRTAWYLAALLVVGSATFSRWILDARLTPTLRMRQVMAVAAGGGGVALLLSLPVQVAMLPGSEGLMLPGRWGSVVFSSLGWAVLVSTSGLAIALLAARRLASPGGSMGALGGGLMALIPLAVTGHTMTAEPAWAAGMANLVHLVVAAVWFGMLAMLMIGLRTWPEKCAGAGAATVARVSAVAMWSVGVLTVAGAALAAVHGRSVEALAASPYGWTLAVKVALVAAVILVAAYNRQRLVPAVEASTDGAAMDRLRATVTIEVLGLVGVLVLTAALVAMPLPAT